MKLWKAISVLSCFTWPPSVVCSDFECGVRDFEGKQSLIIKGVIFKQPGVFPWLVSLRQEEDDGTWSHQCGGSIVTPKVILTAAHCPAEIDGVHGRQMSVRAGDSNLASGLDDFGAQDVPVRDFILHPSAKVFPFSPNHDAALLFLKFALTFSSYVRSVCLPPPYDPGEDDLTRMTVAGWGKDEHGKHGMELKGINVTILKEDTCDSYYNGSSLTPNGFSDDILCASEPDDFGGTCNGDSGSPLVKFDVKTGTFTQRGLVSASRDGICGTRRYPNIYVRVGVPSILIWINQNKIGAHNDTSVPFIPTVNKVCSETESCLPKAHCPDIQKMYNQLVGQPRNNPIIKDLKSRVCNKNKRSFCCPMKEIENTPSLNHCENNNEEYDGTFLPKISDGTCGMSCTVGKKSNFIINGNDTNPGEFPFVALISGSGPLCTGVLLNNYYVLTNAACVFRRDLPVVNYKVTLGEWDLSKEEDCFDQICLPKIQQFDIKQEDIILHERYSPGSMFLNNIALIRLPQPAKRNIGVQFACLPNTVQESEVNMLDLNNRVGTVVGWGKKNMKNQPYSRPKLPKLQQAVSVPIVSQDECESVYPKYVKNIREICAGEAGKGPCAGDGGSPLVVEANNGISSQDRITWAVVGIESYGQSSCASVPDVYTRLSSYMTWVKEKMKP